VARGACGPLFAELDLHEVYGAVVVQRDAGRCGCQLPAVEGGVRDPGADAFRVFDGDVVAGAVVAIDDLEAGSGDGMHGSSTRVSPSRVLVIPARRSNQGRAARAGAREEPDDEAENGQEEDEEGLAQLRGGRDAAVEDPDDRSDIGDQDDQPQKAGGLKAHRSLFSWRGRRQVTRRGRAPGMAPAPLSGRGPANDQPENPPLPLRW
jgi:hypothetical protein